MPKMNPIDEVIASYEKSKAFALNEAKESGNDASKLVEVYDWAIERLTKAKNGTPVNNQNCTK